MSKTMSNKKKSVRVYRPLLSARSANALFSKVRCRCSHFLPPLTRCEFLYYYHYIKVSPEIREQWALVCASYYGFVDIVRELLLNPKIDLTDTDYRSVFHSIRGGSIEVFKLFLPHLNPYIIAVSFCKMCYYDRLDMVQLILDRDDYDPSEHDVNPIKIAAKRSGVEIVKLLLADPRIAIPTHGPCFSHYCLRSATVESAKAIFDDPRMKDCLVGQHSWGYGYAIDRHPSNLNVAIGCGRLEIFNLLLTYPETNITPDNLEYICRHRRHAMLQVTLAHFKRIKNKIARIILTRCLVLLKDSASDKMLDDLNRFIVETGQLR